MNNYVYRITNIKLNKHYYGTRTSKKNIPEEDLGEYYFSSSKDKDFIKDQKENSQDYKYKIIKKFNTRKEAIELEIKLHNKFNVSINESFYNRSKQTSTGWDTTGKVKTDKEKKEHSLKLKGRKKPEHSKIMKGQNNPAANFKTILLKNIKTGEEMLYTPEMYYNKYFTISENITIKKNKVTRRGWCKKEFFEELKQSIKTRNSRPQKKLSDNFLNKTIYFSNDVSIINELDDKTLLIFNIKAIKKIINLPKKHNKFFFSYDKKTLIENIEKMKCPKNKNKSRKGDLNGRSKKIRLIGENINVLCKGNFKETVKKLGISMTFIKQDNGIILNKDGIEKRIESD